MTIDEILDKYADAFVNQDEFKSALYDLILKEVVGEDDKDVRGTTQNPENPAYHTKRAKFKNELRAEQRQKAKELFDETTL